MLRKEPSFASLLVRQSLAMHYGHGWILLPGGNKWHPSIEVIARQQAVRVTGGDSVLKRLKVNVAGTQRTKRKLIWRFWLTFAPCRRISASHCWSGLITSAA